MGRVIRSQRKGAGGIFKAHVSKRKGKPSFRAFDYIERCGFIKGTHGNHCFLVNFLRRN